jgi:ribosomal protein S18 acetylase RimI-like enzyme
MPQALLDGLSVERRTIGWERSIADGSTRVLVAAEPAGAVVGFVATGDGRDDDAGQGVGELFAIYLDPAWWDRGVGRGLFEAGTAALASEFDEATLWVLDTNARARGFYERNGWQPDGATKRAIIGDTEVEEVRYRRRLAGYPRAESTPR